MDEVPRLQLAKRPANSRKRTMPIVVSPGEGEEGGGRRDERERELERERERESEKQKEKEKEKETLNIDADRDVGATDAALTLQTKKSLFAAVGELPETSSGEPRPLQSAARFRIGPARPTGASSSSTSNYHRVSIRTDYAPDLCKDYNETGFCGFGDSCKFLHDRGDYKAGWELDAEWEEEQRQRLGREQETQSSVAHDGEGTAESVAPDPTPTVCAICKETYRRPIVETRCGHRFCEACALMHARASPRCFVCSAPTGGSFKVVKRRM